LTPANRRVGPSKLPADDPREAGIERTPAPPPAAAGDARGARSVALSALGTALGVGLVVAASAAVAAGAHRYVTTSPRFALVRVEVGGNEHRRADAIAAESGLTPGSNVFSLDLDAARARVLADPWVADAALTRRLPGTVQVTVVERRPAALVALGSDVLLAAVDGEPFKRLEADEPADLPVVTGLTAESFAEDREQAKATVRRAIDLAAEYDRAPLAQRAPLQEVHVDAGGAFTLVVGRSPIELALGAPPFRRKLDAAARVIAELDRRRARPQAVLLDGEVRPERVVVRLR